MLRNLYVDEMKKLDKLIVGFTVLWIAIPYFFSYGMGIRQPTYFELGGIAFWVLLIDIPYIIYRIKTRKNKKYQKKIPI